MLADYNGWYWLHGSQAGNLAPPVHERLESIAVPTLIVDGGRDHAYNDAIADTLSTRIPRATLLRLPHAGHMANMEESAAVTRALDELASVALGTTGRSSGPTPPGQARGLPARWYGPPDSGVRAHATLQHPPVHATPTRVLVALDPARSALRTPADPGFTPTPTRTYT